MTSKNIDHIENKLRNRIQRAQKMVAGFLSSHFNKLSNNAQKMLLLLFGLAAGGVCVLLIVQSLWGEENRVFFPFNDITIPEKIHFPDRSNPNLEQEYKRILHYKQMLDSLRTNQNPLYDSILVHRPGLPDSIDQLSKLMEQQIKKSSSQ